MILNMHLLFGLYLYEAIIFQFKVNYRNTGKKCEMCTMLIIDTRCHVVLVSFALPFNIFHTFSCVSIANRELVNVHWVDALPATLLLTSINMSLDLEKYTTLHKTK